MVKGCEYKMKRIMENEKSNKTKWIHLRLAPTEYGILYKRLSKTTCRSMSEYIRDIIFSRPVVTNYRNASLDNLLEQFALLNRELSAIGNNINQATKKLHSSAPDAMPSLLPEYLSQARRLEHKYSEISRLLQVLSESWLR
jgi:hypothetical protein